MNLDSRIRSLRYLYRMNVEVEVIWHFENARAVEAVTHALLRPFLSKRVLGREVYRASLARIGAAVAKAQRLADEGRFGGLLTKGQISARERNPQLYMLANQQLLRERWAMK